MASAKRGVAALLPSLALVLTLGVAGEASSRPPQAPAQKKATKGKTKSKKSAAKPAAEPPGPAGAETKGGLVFSRDVAPILVANCVNCHNAANRGGLDQTTFEGLMKGGKTRKAIVPGKPEESLLIARVKGDEGQKMPPGQNNLSPATIEKLEAWIKSGAILDAGVKADAKLADIAPTAEELRRRDLARMPVAERDKKTEAAGRERLKKAGAPEPEVQSGAGFLLFSNLSKERGSSLLKSLDAANGTAKRVLGGKKSAADGPEKVSVYLFKDRATYVEFVRSIENQEVEASESARAKLNVESPYVAAVDPHGNAPESAFGPAPKSKKGARKKKPADDLGAPERSLAGNVADAYVSTLLAGAGAPTWVSSGLAAYLASQSEPRGRHYDQLRASASDLARIGWRSKATEALGGQAKPESARAVGFALFEWIGRNAPPQATASFVQTMFGGQAKLDEALQACLGMNREQFLAGSAEWIYANYAARGR